MVFKCIFIPLFHATEGSFSPVRSASPVLTPAPPARVYVTEKPAAQVTTNSTLSEKPAAPVTSTLSEDIKSDSEGEEQGSLGALGSGGALGAVRFSSLKEEEDTGRKCEGKGQWMGV